MFINNLIIKFKKIFFYKKYEFFRRLRLIFNIDQKINLYKQSLILPPGHLLSMYNYLYPKYDQFISKLVTKIDNNKSVIDIGANVGDTLFRLYHNNPSLRYYSIEADEYFFNYLKKNKKELSNNSQSNITLIKELVGLDLSGNLTKTNTGTKTLVQGDMGLKSKTLDEIILENNIDDISLIKVDVDGYDFNVLFSGVKSIIKYKPKLFFEYMSLNDKDYVSLIEKLFDIGYKNWSVLDNYGEIMFENESYLKIIEFIKSNSNNNKTIIDIYCY